MHILIVRNNSNSQAIDASLLLAAYLNSQGISYLILDSCELDLQNESALRARISEPFVDMVVALGGDGTILRTARLVGSAGTPILGINFGRLGFLANSSEEGVVPIVAAALAGDIVEEQRSNLRIDVACDGDNLDDFPHAVTPEDYAESEERRSFFALNELAITRGSMGRVIDFGLQISDVHLADMRGDGVVIATATGSTAYALSAGGPLVAPGFDGLVVVPLAPHTLHSRAIVTARNDVVEIDLTANTATREAALFIDGEPLHFEKAPAKICIRKGSEATVLLRYKHEGFYEHASEVFFR